VSQICAKACVAIIIDDRAYLLADTARGNRGLGRVEEGMKYHS
jgi:hypothetical protein